MRPYLSFSLSVSLDIATTFFWLQKHSVKFERFQKKNSQKSYTKIFFRKLKQSMEQSLALIFFFPSICVSAIHIQNLSLSLSVGLLGDKFIG